jgi:hypothetical protein
MCDSDAASPASGAAVRDVKKKRGKRRLFAFGVGSG